MKKRPRPPLFKSIEPDVYIIDTSAWLNIDGRHDTEELWTAIIVLIEQGRIVTPAQVLAELHENPIYLLRLKAYEKALQAGDRNSDDPEYLQHVGKVTFDHPAMSRATSRKTPADSYVVALAELETYVVVADETCAKRPNRKIPGVCQKRGIRCLTLTEFAIAIRSEH
jgi:acyl-CoA-binding protein